MGNGWLVVSSWGADMWDFTQLHTGQRAAGHTSPRSRALVTLANGGILVNGSKSVDGRYLKIGIHKFIFRGGLTIMHFSENGNIKGKGPKPPCKDN